ncbi:glycoside hydrolase family 3 N-terminal domain-containing protein [Amycolatopsis sp. NPDC059090]|uniref:glycoside hydrolase family 3 N-terminal domain-containing protein n=1 Tax=Amycolatopsis sp. NPDC059090 TaxID=3346723 RepID=UPI003672AB4E
MTVADLSEVSGVSDPRRLAEAVLLPGFAGTTAPDWVRRRLAEGLGGVILFGRNVVDDEQVAALTSALRSERDDVVVGIDEEGGDVTRLDVGRGSFVPGPLALGAAGDPELTASVAAALGERLAACGVTVNLAPCADLTLAAEDPGIGVRAFGSDPVAASPHVAAFVTGMQKYGVAACAKHFPGHGAATEDSHLSLPVLPRTAAELRDVELVPFAAAIEAGGWAGVVGPTRGGGGGGAGCVWSAWGGGVSLSLGVGPGGVPFAALGSLSVVAGLAVHALATDLGVDVALKWPNDVLAGPDRAKCAGILAEAVGTGDAAVVLGIGLNVLPLGDDVPAGPGGLPATSLAEQGATTTDRTEIALGLLTRFDDLERRWRTAGGDLTEAGLLGDYRARCATLGQDVQVQLPDGSTLTGRAADLDASGQLQVDVADGRRLTVFAGDVVHVRPA